MILGELKVLNHEYVFNNFADGFVRTTFARFSSVQMHGHRFLLVLYPTTFSRFSSAVIDAVYAKWLYTLQHSQGSQVIGHNKLSPLSFVPYSIFKVLKRMESAKRHFSVLYPTAFSRFSNRLVDIYSLHNVLYPTAFSRFSSNSMSNSGF